MKFTPRLPGENVNVSKGHPLVELAWMLGGLALILIVFYLLVGQAVEVVADRLPTGAERWLGRQALQQFAATESPALDRRLQALIAALPTDSPLRQSSFRVWVADADEINAVALPGEFIVVFRGLLEAVASENELDMVLAHELGHFAHRDHLKGLGRGLVATFLTMTLFGNDSSAAGLMASLTLSFDARYSQRQEAAADAWGLDLLVARYGHAGGAVDFFVRLGRREDAPRLAYLRASHPHPADRIRSLEKRIAERQFRLESVVPFDGNRLLAEMSRP
jgi:predicted Zn-dependent protease